MTINIYDTRTMLKAVNLIKPQRTFLKDNFFGVIKTNLTEKVDVDVKKGKRKMAPFVAPRVGGVVMSREGYETMSISTPKIAPERNITIDDINKRLMGENIYSAKTPEERQREVLANDIIELDDYITRREEWMCRELLLNGKINIKEETNSGKVIEKEIDFNFTNKVTLSGVDLWSNEASDPIQDLKTWKKDIVKKTGKNPDVVIMSDDAVNAFLEHPKVKDLFNRINMKFGILEPTIKIDGTTFYGKLPEIGVEIYSYDEWFAEDGEEIAMIPEGTVIMLSKNTGETTYGAVTQMEKDDFITYEGSRVPKRYSDEQNEVKVLRLTSRPVPVPYDVDSWYVAKVL